MLQRALVYFNPPGRVRDWAAFENVERPHRRRDMQNRVVLLALGPVRDGFEHRLAIGSVDGHEVAPKVPADAAIDAQGLQRIGILLHTEHSRHAIEEIDFDLISATSLAIPIPSHPHDLLRCCREKIK